MGSIHKTWLFSPSFCRHHQGEYLSPRKCIINIRYFELMILGRRFIKLFAPSLSGTSQLSVKRLGNRRDLHIKNGVSSSVNAVLKPSIQDLSRNHYIFLFFSEFFRTEIKCIINRRKGVSNTRQ